MNIAFLDNCSKFCRSHQLRPRGVPQLSDGFNHGKRRSAHSRGTESISPEPKVSCEAGAMRGVGGKRDEATIKPLHPPPEDAVALSTFSTRALHRLFVTHALICRKSSKRPRWVLRSVTCDVRPRRVVCPPLDKHQSSPVQWNCVAYDSQTPNAIDLNFSSKANARP